MTDYTDTIKYLYGLQRHGIKLGLSNINELMRRLGEPHRSFRSIHIAGTNGKGSTAAAVASVLNESGYTVGLFTSPHLVSFTERISVNKRQISESDVVHYTTDIRSSLPDTDINPTFFEIVTALAFYYFSSKSVEWAVVETGMGGRLDATNILMPEITVITNVSLDHREFLGETISDIASEKAGIIKTKVPVITASQNSEVVKILSDTALSKESEIHLYERDFRGKIISMDFERIQFTYSGFGHYNDLILPLSGRYQLANACTAIRVCELLMKQGVNISQRSLRQGLGNVVLEGRLERVSQDPMIFIDSAHNPVAAESLASSMRELFPDKKLILIVGIMSDKDMAEILAPLAQYAEHIILTKAQYLRAASPFKLREIVSEITRSHISNKTVSIQTRDSVSEAIIAAKNLSRKDHIILITGSFYTTGEAKEVLGYHGIMPRLREQL